MRSGVVRDLRGRGSQVQLQAVLGRHPGRPQVDGAGAAVHGERLPGGRHPRPVHRRRQQAELRPRPDERRDRVIMRVNQPTNQCNPIHLLQTFLIGLQFIDSLNSAYSFKSLPFILSDVKVIFSHNIIVLSHHLS